MIKRVRERREGKLEGLNQNKILDETQERFRKTSNYWKETLLKRKEALSFESLQR